MNMSFVILFCTMLILSLQSGHLYPQSIPAILGPVVYCVRQDRYYLRSFLCLHSHVIGLVELTQELEYVASLVIRAAHIRKCGRSRWYSLVVL